MSRATCALPPGLRRSKRRAVLARRLPRRQEQLQPDLNEDEEPDTEVESDESEGLQGLHSGPTAEGLSGVRYQASRALPDHVHYENQRQWQREAELREELLARRSGQWPRGPDRPSDQRPSGPERSPCLSEARVGEVSAERSRGEFYSLGAATANPFFEGPDMGDPEVRATMGMLASTFKIQPFNPDAPDMWVESVDDALYSAGMSAVFQAADCRRVEEVPIRLRTCVDLSHNGSSSLHGMPFGSHFKVYLLFITGPSVLKKGTWRESSGLSWITSRRGPRV
jgi:hypothetical protein